MSKIYLLFLLSGIVAGVLLFIKMPRLPSLKIKHPTIKISVIIPARNEQANLPGLLSSLNNQTLQPFEIICVDDESTDDSAAIIKLSAAQYLPVKNKPPQWTGKTWACQIGAAAAKGDVLLFLDADVRLSPNALRSLVSFYQENPTPISIQPYHTVRKFYEHFSFFFNLIGIAANGAACPLSTKKAGLFGPVILISKTCFTKIGGYSHIYNSIIEDVTLGKLLDKHAIKYNLFVGHNDFSFKMYRSFKDLFYGFGKNYYSGALNTPPLLLVLTTLWIIVLTAAPILIVEALFNFQYIQLSIGLLLYLFLFIQLGIISHQIGSFKKPYLLVYPLFLLGFHLIFLYSIYAKLFSKQVKWKGRDISLKK